MNWPIYILPHPFISCVMEWENWMIGMLDIRSRRLLEYNVFHKYYGWDLLILSLFVRFAALAACARGHWETLFLDVRINRRATLSFNLHERGETLFSLSVLNIELVCDLMFYVSPTVWSETDLILYHLKPTSSSDHRSVRRNVNKINQHPPKRPNGTTTLKTRQRRRTALLQRAKPEQQETTKRANQRFKKQNQAATNVATSHQR